MANSIELRYDGQRLDEVVAHDAVVHLEQMDEKAFALIIHKGSERVCIWISGADIKATVSWHEHD